MKSLSLGRLPWIPQAYFKKTQASKLGDQQIIRSSLVRLYFYFFTLYVLFLEQLSALFSVLLLFYSLVINIWTLALLFGRETCSAFSLEYSYSSLYICWVFVSSTALASSSCFHVSLVRAISSFEESTLLLHLYLFGELFK